MFIDDTETCRLGVEDPLNINFANNIPDRDRTNIHIYKTTACGALVQAYTITMTGGSTLSDFGLVEESADRFRFTPSNPIDPALLVNAPYTV